MSLDSYNARAFSSLGHDARLSIFRLLVKAGNAGLRISAVSYTHLTLPTNREV